MYSSGSRRSNSGNSSRGGSGISMQSDYKSSPIASRKEPRSSFSNGNSRLSRVNTLDNFDNILPESPNGKLHQLFFINIQNFFSHKFLSLKLCII